MFLQQPQGKIREVKRHRNDVDERQADTAAATRRKHVTPQRLELQKHLECDVLLACAATRSRSRRNDRERKYGFRDSPTR